MIPKVLKGRSFKGAASYLLHDVNDHAAQTRVAWTHTRNLATENPDIAWRLMAATAKNAESLKAAAGVKNTGRKAQHPVLHMVLSWHPDEKGDLGREEMIAAAESAIQALGAADRQAIIIGHNDSPHPHIHILLNRHSSHDGRILPSSNERLRLSQWALAYEETRGRIYCENRVLNNDARQRGEFTRGAPPVPRQIIDAEKILKPAANDNLTGLEQLRSKTRTQIRALGVKARDLKSRHAQAWQELEARHTRARAAITATAKSQLTAARAGIISTFRPAWQDLRARHTAETEDFRAGETTRFGRLKNLFKGIDIQRSAADGPRMSVLTQLWKGFTSTDEREAMLSRRQAQDRRRLEGRQREAVRAALIPIHAERKLSQFRVAERYLDERASLILTQRLERAHIRAEWRSLAQARGEAYRALEKSLEGKRSFDAARSAAPDAGKPPAADLYARLKDKTRQSPPPGPAPEQDRDREQERD